jgi:DNA-binding beta-propeller fold protein YncE
MRRFFTVYTFLLFTGLGVRANAQEKQPLRLVQTISIPDIQGRIDHMDADVEGQRLFVAGLENGSLEVVDLAAGKRVRSIPGFKMPTGVYYVPEFDKLFVASLDGTVKVFHGNSLDLIDSIKLEIGVNRVMYDPATKVLYVGYGGKDAGFNYGRVGIIDARSDRYLGGDKITEAHPSEILVDNTAQRILVSNALADRVYVFDALNRQPILTWRTLGKWPADMALDQTRRRLFVGTRTPPEMTVYDSDSGQEVASLPTVEGMDGVYYDAHLKRIYVSGGGVGYQGASKEVGGGSLFVYQQKDADHYEPIGKVPVRGGAGTSHWVPGLNRYFVAAPAHDKQEAAILVFEPQP